MCQHLPTMIFEAFELRSGLVRDTLATVGEFAGNRGKHVASNKKCLTRDPWIWEVSEEHPVESYTFPLDFYIFREIEPSRRVPNPLTHRPLMCIDSNTC